MLGRPVGLRFIALLLVGCLLVVSLSGLAVSADGDIFEPNDDFENASTIPWGEWADLVVEAGGDDFYRIELSEDSDLRVTVNYDPTDGPLELTLYDPEREPIDSSATGAGEEVVSITATEDGDHYIHIRGSDASAMTYTLELRETDSLLGEIGPDPECRISTMLGLGFMLGGLVAMLTGFTLLKPLVSVGGAVALILGIGSFGAGILLPCLLSLPVFLVLLGFFALGIQVHRDKHRD